MTCRFLTNITVVLPFEPWLKRFSYALTIFFDRDYWFVYWCQMGPLQTQAQLLRYNWCHKVFTIGTFSNQLLQLQLMSQLVHDTDIQQSALPDWAVSEPQNRVDNRRRSRSRPPLTDDHRRTGHVEEPARRPGRIEGSSYPPASERSGPTILSHGLFYHCCSPSGPLIETNVSQQFPAVSQMMTILGRPSEKFIQYWVSISFWFWRSMLIADSGFDPDWLIHCCMTWYVVRRRVPLCVVIGALIISHLSYITWLWPYIHMIDNRNLLDHSVELGSSVMSVYVTLAVRSLIHVTILVAMNVRSDFGGPSA